MATWADEISAIIENSITGFGGPEVETASVGTVIAGCEVSRISRIPSHRNSGPGF